MTRLKEDERAAAEAVGFGGTLPAEARRGLRLVVFRPLRKGGLLGFATVEFLALGLVVVDCPVQNTHGRIWCGLPSKPVLDQDGHHVRINGKGQGQYAALLKWCDRARSERFSERVIELVRQQYPGALE
jgi:hypothetical protein